jgi:Adenosine deaminase
LKAHVGEWGTADDVWRAVELLELDEVQDGIAASASRAVMRALANVRIRLNLCPTSNVMLGRVGKLEEHPIRALYDAGVNARGQRASVIREQKFEVLRTRKTMIAVLDQRQRRRIAAESLHQRERVRVGHVLVAHAATPSPRRSWRAPA